MNCHIPPATPLLVQQLLQANNKETITPPHSLVMGIHRRLVKGLSIQKLIPYHDVTILSVDGGSTSSPLIARFMGPTWGPSGADRTQVDPMFFAIWVHSADRCNQTISQQLNQNHSWCKWQLPPLWKICCKEINLDIIQWSWLDKINDSIKYGAKLAPNCDSCSYLFQWNITLCVHLMFSFLLDSWVANDLRYHDAYVTLL